jgi:ABC-type transport system involved in multi-copper enzyme maturation permease subunit
MKWILWREYRLNRLILITGAGLLLLPYLVALVAFCWVKVRGGTHIGADHDRAADVFLVATLFSLGLSQLTVALLGGNATAGERADRSAEFIAYLPLSRPRRLAGKLSLAFSAAVSIWVPSLLILLTLLGAFVDVGPGDVWDIFIGVSYVAITGLTFYGVAWLISSLQSSPTFAVCGGLITPLLIAWGLYAAAWAADMPGPTWDRFVTTGYATICLVLAILCFWIGTWYYLRRVEP